MTPEKASVSQFFTTEQENLREDEDPLIQNLRQVGVSASEDTSGIGQMISDHEDIVSGRK